jgi:hypothetical protein
MKTPDAVSQDCHCERKPSNPSNSRKQSMDRFVAIARRNAAAQFAHTAAFPRRPYARVMHESLAQQK